MNATWKRRMRLCGGAAAASLFAALYGCSSDDSSNNSAPDGGTGSDSSVQNDSGGSPDTGSGGQDSSVQNDTGVSPPDTGAPGQDGSSGSDGSVGDDGGSPDGSGEAGDSGPGSSDASDGAAAIPLAVVTQTNLVSDMSDAGAPLVDSKLQNAWGLAFSPTGVAWISENGTSLLSVYPSPYTTEPFAVGVPAPGASPSGQIFNPDSKGPDGGVGAFKGDSFIASDENGTVDGWQGKDRSDAGGTNGGGNTVAEIDETANNAVFKGLAILPTTPPELAVADFHNGVIRIYDDNYAPVTAAAGKWIDSTIPAGYAPFNIAVSGNNVFVAYAKQKAPANHDDQAGPGNGAISVYSTDGTLVKSLVAVGGALNSPWGMDFVPAGGWAGWPAGTLVVGNFGDGTIVAIDPSAGTVLSELGVSSSAVLHVDGLWAVTFRAPPGSDGGAAPVLYFTAGPNGEANGIFGYLTPSP